MRIAIQGVKGSFHHIVAERFFGRDIELVCCDTFHDVFAALEPGTADKAVMAIENTLYGSIGDNYDLLLAHHYPIIGEEIEHIHQQLIARPDTRLEDITEVYSHPVALVQCRGWLEENLPDAEIIEHYDTAAAVEHVRSLGSPHAAAIASAQAATMYGMAIIAPDVEDDPTNLTRFLILDPRGSVSDDANKASLVLTTPHAPGALYRALGAFAQHGSNLTKLQSRPIRGERFKYQFFIDVECDAPTLSSIADELATQGCDVTVLGHYLASR